MAKDDVWKVGWHSIKTLNEITEEDYGPEDYWRTSDCPTEADARKEAERIWRSGDVAPGDDVTITHYWWDENGGYESDPEIILPPKAPKAGKLDKALDDLIRWGLVEEVNADPRAPDPWIKRMDRWLRWKGLGTRHLKDCFLTRDWFQFIGIEQPDAEHRRRLANVMQHFPNWFASNNIPVSKGKRLRGYRYREGKWVARRLVREIRKD